MNWLTVRDRGAYLRVTGVLFLVLAASGLTAPLLSNYIVTLGADTAQIGLVFTVYQIASLASQYWWGQRSDRLGRRKPLVSLGMGGLALTLLASGLAPTYEVLYLTRIVEGLAFAAYSTGSLALIGDLIEDQAQRGRLMGMYRMVGSLAFAITALAGGWIADTFGIRMPIYCAVGCFTLGFLLVSTMREQPPAAAPQAATPTVSDESVIASVNLQVLIPFLGLTFVWFFGMSSVVTLWPVFMKSEGYTQTQISGLWGLAAAGEVVWLFVVGLLADRVGRKWLLITGVAGQACIYIAYTIAQGFAWFLPIQAIRSFTYSSYETPALLYATELGLRQRRGRLAGLYHTASGIGGVIGAAFGGSVAKAIGMRPMFLIVAGVMILLAIIAAVIMPNRVAPAPALQSQPASA